MYSLQTTIALIFGLFRVIFSYNRNIRTIQNFPKLFR